MKKLLSMIILFCLSISVSSGFSIDEAFDDFIKEGGYEYEYYYIAGFDTSEDYSVEDAAKDVGYTLTSKDYEKFSEIEKRIEKILENDIDGKISDRLNSQLLKIIDSGKISNQTMVYIFSILDILKKRIQKEYFLKKIEEVNEKVSQVESSIFYSISCTPETSEVIKERMGCESYKKDIMRGYIYEGMNGFAFKFLNEYYLEDKYILEIDDSNLGEYYCQNLEWKTECLWVTDGEVTDITKYYW